MRIFMVLAVFVLAIRFFLFYSQPQEIEFTNNAGRNIPIVSPLKDRITEFATKTLPPDDAALLLGIVFGDKGNFDEEYFEAIRTTGVLHVIAASGMNVAMVAGVIFATLVFFMKRRRALVVASVAILIYTAFAEFEESIVRASIMAIFGYGAALIGRQNTGILALLFAAFIMLLTDPALILSVGFQLSFTATAGIILFDPIFKRFGKNYPGIIKAFLEDGRTTIAAQVATLPILIFYFETFSPISVIANLLILWTIPPIMVLGGVAAFISLIIPILAEPAFWIIWPLLAYFKFIIIFISDYAFELDVKNMPIFIVIGYYMVILALILWLWKQLKIRL